MNEGETGVRRVVWIPNELDEIIESVRKRLGISRSGFYRNAVLRYLESLSVISSRTLLIEEKRD
ncbi:MAG: hypothetical protein QXG68_05435 [Candidatus Bathyarchaeia archaeon]